MGEKRYFRVAGDDVSTSPGLMLDTNDSFVLAVAMLLRTICLSLVDFARRYMVQSSADRQVSVRFALELNPLPGQDDVVSGLSPYPHGKPAGEMIIKHCGLV